MKMINNPRGRTSQLLFGLSLVVAMLIFIPDPASATGTNYYVSDATGSDTNAGNSTSAPFKTIQKAASVAVAGDTVNVMAGTYRETVTPTNSGTATNPITFQKYNNDDVTISGLDVVSSTGWQVDSGNIYKHTSTASPLELENSQVFVDGQEMTLAQWPNKGSGRATWTSAGSSETPGNAWVTGATIPGGDDAWKGGVIYAAARQDWGFYSWKVTGYTASTHRVAYLDPGIAGSEYKWELPTDNYASSKGFVMVGARVALDAPTEFYPDKDTNTLYLYAPAGDSPANHNVEIKTRKWGFDLGASNYINIKGLKFFGDGIRTWDSHDSVIDGIVADYPAVSRIHYSTPADLEYPYADWQLSTDSGVVLGGIKGSNHFGKANTLENSIVSHASTTGAVALGGEGDKVVNNEISDVSMGVWANGSDFLISYNTISNTGMNAIHGLYHNTIIEHNDLSSMLLDGQTDDGATHTFAADLGNSVWRYNIIHDFSAGHLTAGLYADNATLNLGIYKNVIYNLGGPSQWGTLVNGLSENVEVDNNTFVNPGFAGFNSYGGAGYNNFGANNITTNSTFSTAMAGSSKSNNLENTDPLFVNQSTHDFHLQSTSPAIDAGMLIPGIADSYNGSAPDDGAYEYNGANWTAGRNFANPPPTTSTPGVWPRMNLVKNSSFEARLWGGAIQNLNWYDGWTISDSSVDVHKSLSSWDADTVNTRTSAILNQGDWISQTITGLSPNTTYDAGAYLRMETAGVGSASMTVENFGGPAVTPVTGNAGSMQHRILEFTTGPTSTSATIKVYKDNTTANAAYVDNVSLIDAGKPRGPIGHWTLDESSGTVAADSSGSSANATVSGTTSWVPGKSGNALNLGTTTSHADIGLHNVGSPSGVTLSMWVKTTSTASNSYLFGGWDEGPNVQFTMNNGAAGKINLYHPSFGRISSTTSVNDGSWHLVTWRYVKGGTFKIYIDGTEEASAAVGTINWDNWYWIIGAEGSTKASGINGSIDDVQVYDRALDPSEIQSLYSTTAPIAYWKLDESSGTVAADSSGNAANATVSGTTGWLTGHTGNALNLGSATSHADIGLHNVGSPSGVTLSMWLKTTSTASNSYLFGGWDEGPNVQFTLNTGATGKVNLYHSSFGRISSTTSVNDGTWHLVTWRYEKNGTFKIYIDGAEEASAAVGTINWDNWYWILGAEGSTKASGFNGSIDDVRLYKRALSPSEIQSLYSSPGNLAQTNFAQGKTAIQSSTYGAAAASRAVDGNTDGNYFAGSVTSTLQEANAWWSVDLGQTRAIGNIEVWNRTDGVPERLSDYWVFVSPVPFTANLTPAQRVTEGVATGFHQTTQAGSPTSIPVNLSGRYVMVQLSGTNYLSLAELKVLSAP
ncbi:DUF1565 domain-containing protein [Nocardioides marmorisolisilvae]|uniref:DUF1565 domain-containing protein n=2 Tax=Nocardioides marmorisolisilvae TaxID=1542737 RepID=A0A3N0DPS5_9ACTN|nr:DUF1565 domain-containing protein [Nocardioides marmorisolisilvae]